jgi:hypothetical protein
MVGHLSRERFEMFVHQRIHSANDTKFAMIPKLRFELRGSS